MTREEWLARRQQGIGGSDVAGILGMSPWATPMSVWLSKTQPVEPDNPSEAMEDGLDEEAPLARRFERRTGLCVVDPQREVVDVARPWRRCTLDGLVAEHPAEQIALDDALGVYEAKQTTGYGLWADDGIPSYYQVQLEWAMGLSCLPASWLTVQWLRPSRDGWFRRETEIIEYAPQPGVWEMLQEHVDRFWHDHVLARVPPAGDGSIATTKSLNGLWTETLVDPVAVDDMPDVVEALELLPAAKDAAKAAKETVDGLEQTIKAAMGAHQEATVDGQVAATWRHAQAVDSAAALGAWPTLTAYTRAPELDLTSLKKERPGLDRRIRALYPATGSRRFNVKKRSK